MSYPETTALYGGLLALLFAALSVWVIGGRFRFGALHGDGGEDRLNRRIRAHANFAEYVPLILLLAALLESGGASRVTLHALLAPLLIARLAHPFGMLAPAGSPQQFVLRGTSAVVTLAVLIAAACLLLMRATGAG